MLTIEAIDRLNSIPSEMQVVRMLHDRGHILNEAPVASEISNAFQRNHIDIAAYLSECKPGSLLEFKIDVKSHKDRYENIFLETQTRPDKNGTRHPSWAFAAYGDGDRDITQKNRYLADVLDECDGTSFRQTIKDRHLIDTNKAEEENAEKILSFFSEHIELLDHDIIIYSFEDINSFLRATGGIDLERREDSESKVTGVKYIKCEWTEWDKTYGRHIYSWNREKSEWTVSHKGKRVHEVEGLPYWRSIWPDGTEVSERDNEYGMCDFIAFWKQLQANGLTVERFKRILGHYRDEHDKRL